MTYFNIMPSFFSRYGWYGLRVSLWGSKLLSLHGWSNTFCYAQPGSRPSTVRLLMISVWMRSASLWRLLAKSCKSISSLPTISTKLVEGGKGNGPVGIAVKPVCTSPRLQLQSIALLSKGDPALAQIAHSCMRRSLLKVILQILVVVLKLMSRVPNEMPS